MRDRERVRILRTFVGRQEEGTADPQGRHKTPFSSFLMFPMEQKSESIGGGTIDRFVFKAQVNTSYSSEKRTGVHKSK